MYALTVCVNFFVSCEPVFNRYHLNVLVIDIGSNDECAVALSYEAKRLGMFKVKYKIALLSINCVCCVKICCYMPIC